MIFSYSRLKQYEICPAAFSYKYLLELPEPATEPLVLGKAVHAVIQRYLNGDNMDTAVQTSVDEAELPLDVEEVETLAGHPEVLDIMGGVAEQHFSLALNDSGSVVLQGYIDWWKDDVRGIVLKDWKTNRNPYAPMNNHQLGLYALALSRLTGSSEVDGELVFLRYPFMSYRYRHKYTRQDMYEARQWALNLAGEIQAKLAQMNSASNTLSEITLFPDRPNTHCQYCGYASLCINSVKIEPVTIADLPGARKVAAEVLRLEAAVDDLKQKLKSWVKYNDAVQVNDAVFTFVPSASWQFENEKLRELCSELESRGMNFWQYLTLTAAQLKKTGLMEDEIKKFGTKKETLTFRHIKAG